MSSRQRIHDALELRTPDRVPVTETGYWPQTIERWRKEGLPHDADPITYLGMDRFLFVSYDDTLGLEERTLSESHDKIVKVDRDGATFVHWKTRYGPPLPLRFLIEGDEDWARHRDFLTPTMERLDNDFLANYAKLRDVDGFLCLSQREPCWKALAAMLGMKNGLATIVRRPQLVRDMVDTYTDLLLGMYELMIDKGAELDGIWLRGDLAYKNGLLFSPETYDHILYPSHSRIANFFDSNGIPVIQHIDGDVRQYIPLIAKSGFSAIQPLECRANNDVRELKTKWGRDIAFIGNISVDALSGTRKQVEAEVASKMLKAKEGGGYIFHSDHSVPPTVSWSNYCYAIKVARDIGGYP